LEMVHREPIRYKMCTFHAPNVASLLERDFLSLFWIAAFVTLSYGFVHILKATSVYDALLYFSGTSTIIIARNTPQC